MGMREYSGNGYLVDLRIFEELNKNVCFSKEEMTKIEEKIKLLDLKVFLKKYLEDEDESYNYNFYEYMKKFEGESGNFIYFSDEDNVENFEYDVLYLPIHEDELYIKTKTDHYKKLEENEIIVEYGDYGFWG